MRLKWLTRFVVAMNVYCENNTSSQAVDLLSSALRAATFPLTITPAGDLQDAGGKLMTDAIRNSQFVLIGESHFSQETPRVAAAVCRIMRPDSYAVEAGPYAAAYVNGLLKDPQRASRMKERERAFPANMAFLNDEQENDLAASCAAWSQTKNFALLGPRPGV